MRERVDHRLLESSPWILLRIRRLEVGLVEQRHGFGVEELLKAARLIEQRSGDLEATSDGIGAIEPRVGGEDRERAGDEALGLSSEEQHGEVPRTQHAGERLGHAQRRHERRQLDPVDQVGLDTTVEREDPHALQRVPQREQVDVVHGRGVARPPIPGLQCPLANEQVLEEPVPRLDGGAAHPHEVLRPLVVSAKRVRGARSRLEEDQDPPLRIVRLELLDQRRQGRRNAIPAPSQDRVLDLLQARRGEPRANEPGKSALVLLLLRTAYHVAAAQILEVVREGRERLDDVVDVSDVLFPFRLLALPSRELLRGRCGPSREHHLLARPDEARTLIAQASQRSVELLFRLDAGAEVGLDLHGSQSLALDGLLHPSDRALEPRFARIALRSKRGIGVVRGSGSFPASRGAAISRCVSSGISCQPGIFVRRSNALR